MEVKVSEMTRRILALLNESQDELEEAVIYGDMGMELRRLAAELLPSAAGKVFREASHTEIDEAKPLGGIMTRGSDGVLELELTPNFLRLVEVRMSDWSESLYDWREPKRIPAKAKETPAKVQEQVLRHHYYDFGNDAGETGVADDDVKAEWYPAVMPGMKGQGRVMRIWGAGPDATPVAMHYLPEPAVSHERIWIPRGLVQPVVRECANMIKDVIGG